MAELHIEIWKPMHDRILCHVIEGLSPPEISKKVRLSESQVSRILNAVEFKDKYNKTKSRIETIVSHKREMVMRKSLVSKRDPLQLALKILLNNVPQAVRKIVQLQKSGTSKEKIQLDAAKEILHMAGLKPVEVVETRTRQYTPEEITRAKQTMEEIVKLNERLNNQGNRFVLKTASQLTVETPGPAPIDASPSTDESSDVPIKRIADTSSP